MQNKLLWAISRKTAAELVASRADGELPFMGMQSCDKILPQRITKNDAVTAKNSLSEDELNFCDFLLDIDLFEKAFEMN